MIVLDATVVNVALPSIKNDLDFTQNNLAWVVNAYLIAFGGLLLLAGRLGDLLGHRRVFLAGLAMFTGASLLCALAQSQEMLIAARFVQGAGGAPASAVTLGMIVTMFPEPRDQAKAIGVYGFVASAGRLDRPARRRHPHRPHQLALDLLRERADRCHTALLALRLVDEPAGHRHQRGRRRPRRSAGDGRPDARRLHDPRRRAARLDLGPDADPRGGLGALVAAFVLRQARIEKPLMPLRLFHSRNVTGANIVMALLVVGMFGIFFLGALYLQLVLGYDPLEVGLAFLPGSLLMGVLSLGFTDKINMRFGPRRVLIAASASCSWRCCSSRGRRWTATT